MKAAENWDDWIRLQDNADALIPAEDSVPADFTTVPHGHDVPRGHSVPMGTLLADDNNSLSISDPDLLRMSEGSASITEAILRPGSIAAVPSYLLRFVPYVGSAPVLIAVALRQAYYRAAKSHENTERQEESLFPLQGDEVSVDAASIMRMLGDVISRAKFFRIFKEGKLDWFVTRAEAEHVFKDGHIMRSANTYQYRGMLLTPGDASDLYAWLIEHHLHENPAEVLTLALQTSRDKILHFPFRTVTDDESLSIPQAASVHDVVRMALGERRLSAALSGMCDALAFHLIRPGSFLSIPWYWFRKVLPHLGDDLGTLYLMCKNCTYVDWVHGRDRNTFWVPGGLPTLQAWIGSTTLPKRIPHHKTSLRGRPRNEDVKDNSEYVRAWREETRNLAGQYLCRVGTRRSDAGQDWLIEVYEPALTDADEQVKDALYTFLDSHLQKAQDVDLPALLNHPKAVSLLYKAVHACENDGICHYETLVQRGICHFETLEPELIRHFDTLADALLCHFETLVGENICHFDTILNILLRLKNTDLIKNSYQPPHTSMPESTSEAQNQEVEGYFREEGWDLDKILARVNPILAQRVRESVTPQGFVSWLMMGALTPAIKTPLSFAVSKAIESRMDSGGAAARLAALNPSGLCWQVIEAHQRLQAGYYGGSLAHAGVSADLRAYLDAVESTAEKLQLLQRLMDELGIQGR